MVVGCSGQAVVVHVKGFRAGCCGGCKGVQDGLLWWVAGCPGQIAMENIGVCKANCYSGLKCCLGWVAGVCVRVSRAACYCQGV